MKNSRISKTSSRAKPTKKESVKPLDPKYKFRDIASAYGITGYKLREFSDRVQVPQYKLVTESEFKKLYKQRYGITL